MGMPDSLEYPQEPASRAFGNLLQEGFMAVIHNDIHVFGNTIDELFHSWHHILQRMQLNNLPVSATKPSSVHCERRCWDGYGKLALSHHAHAKFLHFLPQHLYLHVAVCVHSLEHYSKCY